ncbi:MAG: FHA domain-containing protein [Bifidobacteriaceae bacterium]|jgi:S-DNA-T family DNA segregation ATPase FtsK/SpoIIIE|nr:FHA domain-containing protein [Bifidobacteriaceae bacterium]
MKIKLNLAYGGYITPVVVTADGTATVAHVAAALRAGVTQTPVAEDEIWTIQIVDETERPIMTLPPRSTLAETSLYSGQRVRSAPVGLTGGLGTASDAAGQLRVITGPDSGMVAPLRFGPNLIGRSDVCDVVLSDPLVSRQHARLVIGDQAEIADIGSANGIIVRGAFVQHAILGSDDSAIMGETTISVDVTGQFYGPRPALAFNRSPLVRPKYQGREFAAPKPPAPRKPGRFPIVAMAAPLLMGLVMFLMTRNPLSVVFICLSPLIAIGTWLDRKFTDGKTAKQDQALFDEELDKLEADIAAALQEERLGRQRETPSLAFLQQAAYYFETDLWHRRPETEDFLALNLGLGSTLSRHAIEIPPRGEAVRDTWKALADLQERAKHVSDVPIVMRLRECGNLGVAGDRSWVDSVAAGLIVQLVCLHSPAEVIIAAIASMESAPRWNWLMWLPHVGSTHSPIPGAHLAADPAAVSALVTAVEGLVAARRAASRDNTIQAPALVLIVEDDAPIERGRLVSLAEHGPDVGVHLFWLAEQRSCLPAACHCYLECAADATVTAGFVKEDRADIVTQVEGLTAGLAEQMALHLCPIVDAGAPVIDQSDIPRSVSYLALTGPSLADEPMATLERWQEAGSLPGGPKSKSAANLKALIGQAAQGPFTLDLRTQGPHALVGGTTGAGKSEFLQSWILGMAAAHSPYRVTFLFVDYKGGSAFADCVGLPHTVGLVTDLSTHLVRRALTSLRAELRHREHLLNAKKAKDLISLERTGDPECPPSLIIVVDEFAALVNEVPEFVDGVVDVAQRGRSLGLHLILATQRPAGVIKDNLRANTNLRVALRMADEADSDDVIGTKLAAEFDPRIPGRGAVRTGPGRIALFQAGYAGGHTSSEPEPPRVDIETMTFGPGQAWEIPRAESTADPESQGPTDIARIVAAIRAAADSHGIPEPRKPWLPELAERYDLAELMADADLPPPSKGQVLLLGKADVPGAQAQAPVFYDPDKDGNLAVFGTGGSGKSALLRTLAVGAGLQAGMSRTEVYGLDFGSSGLAMLAPLPHVGAIISSNDSERVKRLLDRLTRTMEERAPRFAAARVDTITDYRAATGEDAEARILLLVDGFGAFREAYETATGLSRYFALFLRLAAEGRSVGIHVVVAAERPGAIPSALAANMPRRLVLRQADENAYLTLGVKKDILSPTSPPGRGVFSEQDDELQVAVAGGSSNAVEQSDEIEDLAAGMRARGLPEAEGVRSLPTLIRVAELPDQVNGLPVLGVSDADLQPIPFSPQGAFVIAGMPGSGRTTALRSIAQMLRKWDPVMPIYYFGSPRSGAHKDDTWTDFALDSATMRDLAAELKPKLEAGAVDKPGLILVIEGVGELIGSPVEQQIVELMRLARRNGHFVIGESEMANWGSSWPIISEVRNNRRGVAMQPDSTDVEILFKVTMPRARRSDYPPGRCVFVDSGKVHTVQLGRPD